MKIGVFILNNFLRGKIAVLSLILITVFLFLTITSILNSNVIIDSDMTMNEALQNTKAPPEVIDDLVLLDVTYYSFDNNIHKGQIVVHKDVEQDIREIFNLILKMKFPVNKVIPIVKYDWSDDASMEDNNTSAFCYRFIAGTTRLSNHAFGKAIDINPFNNPVIHKDGSTSPGKAKYNPKKPGTFYKEHPIVQEFLKRGWRWGGDFNSYKDNHHFDK
ncbi:MAG: M15 family metallopeptidase [bacterium]